VIQHATIEEAVFFLGSKEARIISQSNSGVRICSRELRESPELAVGRIMARKELGCAKKTS
jgi:hypothetical protein